MNGIIQMLVEYFRNLSNLHPDVNGFLTGEKYDSNLNWQEYPIVFLRYPMAGTMEEDFIYVNLELGCYTNDVKPSRYTPECSTLTESALPLFKYFISALYRSSFLNSTV